MDREKKKLFICISNLNTCVGTHTYLHFLVKLQNLKNVFLEWMVKHVIKHDFSCGLRSYVFTHQLSLTSNIQWNCDKNQLLKWYLWLLNNVFVIVHSYSHAVTSKIWQVTAIKIHLLYRKLKQPTLKGWSPGLFRNEFINIESETKFHLTFCLEMLN